MIPPCGFAPLGVLVAGRAAVVDMLGSVSWLGRRETSNAKACASNRTDARKEAARCSQCKPRSNKDKKGKLDNRVEKEEEPSRPCGFSTLLKPND